jgi:hypothetical protein
MLIEINDPYMLPLNLRVSDCGWTMLPGIVVDDAPGHSGPGAGWIGSGPEPTCEIRRGESDLVEMPRGRAANRPSGTRMETIF